MMTVEPEFHVVSNSDSMIDKIVKAFMEGNPEVKIDPDRFKLKVYNSVDKPLFNITELQTALDKTNLRSSQFELIVGVDYIMGRVWNKNTNRTYSTRLLTRSGLTLLLAQSKGQLPSIMRRFMAMVFDELAKKEIAAMSDVLENMKNQSALFKTEISYWKEKCDKIGMALEEKETIAQSAMAEVNTINTMLNPSKDEVCAEIYEKTIKENVFTKVGVYINACPAKKKKVKVIYHNDNEFDDDFYEKNGVSIDDDISDVYYDFEPFQNLETPETDGLYYYSFRRNTNKKPKKKTRAYTLRSIQVSNIFIYNKLHLNLFEKEMEKYKHEKNMYLTSLENIQRMADDVFIKNAKDITAPKKSCQKS